MRVCVLSSAQDKVFESLEGEQLQPYMDAIELEGNAAQPMDEGGVEEAKVNHHFPRFVLLLHSRSLAAYVVVK